MSIRKSSFFSSKKRNNWIFSFIFIFSALVFIKAGDVYYNNFSDWLRESSSNIIVLPKIKEVPFRLGLDLQGGAQLTYQADVSAVVDGDYDDLLEGVRDLIERRVNAFGVSEPVVQVNKTSDNDYRVIVELAGIRNIDDAIAEIGETPRLEFKEQDLEGAEISQEQLELMSDYNQGLLDKMDDVLEKIEEGQDFKALAMASNTPVPLSSDPGAPGAENDGDLGWINSEDDPYLHELMSMLEVGQISDVIESEYDVNVFKLEDSRELELSEDQEVSFEYKVRYISLPKMTKDQLRQFSDSWKNTELSGANLRRAVLTFNPQDNRPEVSLEFDSEGALLFEEITQRNIGKPVAIYLDDYPISTPNVNEKISGGRAVISGSFTVEEARELVQRLKAGALPVPIELINQKTVGASLGQKSVQDSLEAGIIGLALVALFMLVVYRLFGLSAVLSLFVYGLSVLAIFKALPVWGALLIGLLFLVLILSVFEELKILDMTLTLIFSVIGIILFFYGINSVTLTLAGVAGFILSIGMAVDANVLIFERIKEELRSGRSIRNAIDEGVRKAWPSIRDGNFSTLLICLVLMNFGTSVLKGFGTTLFIGVSISMFSAIVITRSFMLILLNKKIEKISFLFGVKLKK